MSNDSRTDRPRALPGIDYQFRDPGLLERALTHRSCGPGHYERLEFLGDSLLSLVISEQLYRRWPHAPEGDLSRLRSRLVRDVTLASLARELDLGPHLRLGAGELRSGGFLRDSILADVFEALLGAIYLDGGFDAARQVICTLFEPRLQSLPDADSLKDPKTRLQELLQSRGYALPEYQVIEESGADHAKRFLVECRAQDLIAPVTAEAGSRRKAEQAAARIMHERLVEHFDGRADEGSQVNEANGTQPS
ncbi:ribonuclease III [Wenzhouxiangella sp. AB-CW3]|uniref:ribonuclease III n=1 Tax=Wenzhouxiangella sp. AB-CW3 TaxID=2771012 RepID=UPI001CC2D9E9|nr:ribonuclease III [Wenzhouxiangella sp. AB-CW3]